MLGPDLDSASNVNKMDGTSSGPDAAAPDIPTKGASSDNAESNALQPEADSSLNRLFQTKHFDLLVFLAIVILSLPVFLSQNPSSVLPRTTMYFDAAHYLETTKRLFDTVGMFFAGKLTAGALDSLAFYLFLDGPVLPGAASILFFLLGKTPALAEWQCLVIMQCVFQSFCSGFVYLLSRIFMRKRLIAVCAAVLWTSYPSAISSCNSFLTEPLATLLAVSFLYWLNAFSHSLAAEKPQQGTGSGLKYMAAGVSFSLLVLLKPALAPAAVAATAVYVCAFSYQLLKDKALSFRKILPSILAAAGAAIVFVPWLGFGYAARHSLTILPSRRPVYNIATGCNIEGDGWGCYPTHPLALMHDDNEAALPVALALIEANPPEIANLSLRKITRLWDLPWNDYRYKILGLNYHIQSIYHLLLVALGIGGNLLLFAQIFKSDLAAKQKLAAASIMLFLAGHLIYLPFEGIGRYGFTSMPFLAIASVYLIQTLSALRRNWLQAGIFLIAFVLMLIIFKLDLLPFISLLIKDSDSAVLALAALRTAFVALCAASLAVAANEYKNKALLSAVVCLTILAGSVAFAFALSDRETQQWQTNLHAGDIAERAVNLSTETKPDWALLLVDGDHNLESATATVNGEPLRGKFESYYQFQTEKYELEDWLNQFASLTRRSPSANRKWRAISVPVSMIKNGWNVLSISPSNAEQSVTIYGDYSRKHQGDILMLPSPDQVSPGKYFNDSEDAFDSRIIQSTNSKVCFSKSTFVHSGGKQPDDLSNKAGRQTGQYRIYLLFGYRNNKNIPEPEKAPSKALRFTRSLSAGPAPDTPIKLNEGQLYPQIPVAIPAQCRTGTHIRVRIFGKARAAISSSFSIAGISTGNKRFMDTVLPGAPRVIASATKTWTAFDFESDLPTITTSDENPLLQVELRPVEGNTEIAKLQIELQPANKPQLSGHSIRVF